MIEGKSFYGSYGSMTIWKTPSLRNIWMIEVSDSEYCHRGSVQVAKEEWRHPNDREADR